MLFTKRYGCADWYNKLNTKHPNYTAGFFNDDFNRLAPGVMYQIATLSGYKTTIEAADDYYAKRFDSNKSYCEYTSIYRALCESKIEEVFFDFDSFLRYIVHFVDKKTYGAIEEGSWFNELYSELISWSGDGVSVSSKMVHDAIKLLMDNVRCTAATVLVVNLALVQYAKGIFYIPANQLDGLIRCPIGLKEIAFINRYYFEFCADWVCDKLDMTDMLDTVIAYSLLHNNLTSHPYYMGTPIAYRTEVHNCTIVLMFYERYSPDKHQVLIKTHEDYPTVDSTLPIPVLQDLFLGIQFGKFVPIAELKDPEVGEYLAKLRDGYRLNDKLELSKSYKYTYFKIDGVEYIACNDGQDLVYRMKKEEDSGTLKVSVIVSNYPDRNVHSITESRDTKALPALRAAYNYGGELCVSTIESAKYDDKMGRIVISLRDMKLEFDCPSPATAKSYLDNLLHEGSVDLTALKESNCK